jgi:hypothetical protein
MGQVSSAEALRKAHDVFVEKYTEPRLHELFNDAGSPAFQEMVRMIPKENKGRRYGEPALTYDYLHGVVSRYKPIQMSLESYLALFYAFDKINLMTRMEIQLYASMVIEEARNETMTMLYSMREEGPTKGKLERIIRVWEALQSYAMIGSEEEIYDYFEREFQTDNILGDLFFLWIRLANLVGGTPGGVNRPFVIEAFARLWKNNRPYGMDMFERLNLGSTPFSVPGYARALLDICEKVETPHKWVTKALGALMYAPEFIKNPDAVLSRSRQIAEVHQKRKVLHDYNPHLDMVSAKLSEMIGFCNIPLGVMKRHLTKAVTEGCDIGFLYDAYFGCARPSEFGSRHVSNAICTRRVEQFLLLLTPGVPPGFMLNLLTYARRGYASDADTNISLSVVGALAKLDLFYANRTDVPEVIRQTITMTCSSMVGVFGFEWTNMRGKYGMATTLGGITNIRQRGSTTRLTADSLTRIGGFLYPEETRRDGTYVEADGAERAYEAVAVW